MSLVVDGGRVLAVVVRGCGLTLLLLSVVALSACVPCLCFFLNTLRGLIRDCRMSLQLVLFILVHVLT